VATSLQSKIGVFSTAGLEGKQEAQSQTTGSAPRAFAKSQTHARHPPTSRHFFSWICFSAFSGVPRQGGDQGGSKTPLKYFFQKSMSKVEDLSQIPNKSTKNFDASICQFFLDFLCFIAFSGVSQ
jgi:hypothetical protein